MNQNPSWFQLLRVPEQSPHGRLLKIGFEIAKVLVLAFLVRSAYLKKQSLPAATGDQPPLNFQYRFF